MRILRLSIFAMLASLAACATPGSDIPHWFDLQYKLSSFYRDRAQENGAMCNLPEMSVTGVQVAQETQKELTLDVSYTWRDLTYGNGNPFDVFSGGCFGTAERQFIVSKNTDGTYTVEKMSGAQRD